MDAKTLVKQFVSDPTLTFFEIIRDASSPIGKADVIRILVSAGVDQRKVELAWTRLLPLVKVHPQIHTRKGNKYEFAAERQSTQSSLDALARYRQPKVPDWLAQALVQNVTHGVAAEPSDSAWADKEFQKARLVADLAAAVEMLRSEGGTISDVTNLFEEELHRKRLWPIGKTGEKVAFDPESHEAKGREPRTGTAVKVVRPGYVWRGGSEPITAAKALVSA